MEQTHAGSGRYNTRSKTFLVHAESKLTANDILPAEDSLSSTENPVGSETSESGVTDGKPCSTRSKQGESRRPSKKNSSHQHRKSSFTTDKAVLSPHTSKIVLLTKENIRLKSENETLLKTNQSLSSEINQLKATLADKDASVHSLQTSSEAQYSQLRTDMMMSSKRLENHQGNIRAGLRKQNYILTEISKAVQFIYQGFAEQDNQNNNTRHPANQWE